MDKEAIQASVRAYLHADAALARAKEEQARLTAARDAAKSELLLLLPKQSLTIATPVGKLQQKEVKSTGSLTKTVLQSALQNYWQEKRLPGSSDDLLDVLWSSRPQTTKWDLELKN